jgi:hypothetical protein
MPDVALERALKTLRVKSAELVMSDDSIDNRPSVTRHGTSNSANRPYAAGSEQARGRWFARAAESSSLMP